MHVCTVYVCMDACTAASVNASASEGDGASRRQKTMSVPVPVPVPVPVTVTVMAPVVTSGVYSSTWLQYGDYSTVLPWAVLSCM